MVLADLTNVGNYLLGFQVEFCKKEDTNKKRWDVHQETVNLISSLSHTQQTLHNKISFLPSNVVWLIRRRLVWTSCRLSAHKTITGPLWEPLGESETSGVLQEEDPPPAHRQLRGSEEVSLDREAPGHGRQQQQQGRGPSWGHARALPQRLLGDTAAGGSRAQDEDWRNLQVWRLLQRGQKPLLYF